MTWQNAQSSFAAKLEGYEDRAEQTRLAETIEKALANGRNLAAQAGTGTGKSLAALVPAIDHAVKTHLPVVVSTATKSLQHQYGDKDLPFLTENLDVDFAWALLKGRSNYACLAKIAELPSDTLPGQDGLVEEIMTLGFSGDIEDLRSELDVKDRFKITSSSDECPGKNDCPFGNVCFAEKAKLAAKDADVILVNHAMLATDLIIREQQLAANPDKEPMSVLPNFGSVVIDEGHEFAEYMSGALSNEFSERGLHFFAAEVGNFLGKGANLAPVNGAAKSLFLQLARVLGRKTTAPLNNTALLSLEDELVNLIQALVDLHEQIVAKDIRGDDKAKLKRSRLMKRSHSLQDRLRSIILAESSELVRWVERDERRDDVRLKFAPLTVAPFLREALWRDHEGVILSATLSVGKDYSFVTGNLGMDEYDTFDAGSPFNYPEQAALFIPADMVEPTEANKGRWRVQAQETMRRLVLAAGGRSLLLFTSTEAMKEAHAALVSSFEAAGLQVLIQNGPLTNKQLAAEFKADETSVLFGLKSFATGFDVRGDALRLTVLDKLPFASPDDVIFKARSEAIDRVVLERRLNKWVHGSFPKLAMPKMALELFQGVGRLIRSKTDEGMIAILDSRLHSKKYGRDIRSTLPPARPIKALEDAESYLADLKARRG